MLFGLTVIAIALVLVAIIGSYWLENACPAKVLCRPATRTRPRRRGRRMGYRGQANLGAIASIVLLLVALLAVAFLWTRGSRPDDPPHATDTVRQLNDGGDRQGGEGPQVEETSDSIEADPAAADSGAEAAPAESAVTAPPRREP